MTPRRRGLFATLFGFGLALLISVGVALAVFMNTKPSQGPRDDGAGNQTQITLSGDLLDPGPDTAWQLPRAYWDTPDPPSPAYQIPILGGGSVAGDGQFSFNVNVPLTDGSGAVVRPGAHVVTVCAVHGRIVDVCITDGFNVLKGTAVLSKTQGRQGSLLTISGDGWVPENAKQAIRITWAPAGADIDMVSDVFGPSTWAHTIFVPDLPSGTYVIRVCNVSNLTGECSKDAKGNLVDFVDKQFTILDPILTVSPASGFGGVPFDFSGDLFYASQQVKIWFGPEGKPIGDPSVHEIGPPGATTNGDGHFGQFTYAPTDGPGDYTVTACTLARLSCNSVDIATKPYTILAPTTSPSPTPSPEPTDSPTPTPTASPSATASPSPTSSPSPTLSPTPSLALTVAPASAAPTEPSASPTVPPTAAPTPAPTPTAEPAVTWPEHLRSPGQTAGGGGLDLGTLGGMSLLALLIAFLVPFPGTLFNKTVEANHTEIMGWIAGLKRRWTSLVDAVAKGPLGPVRTWLAGLLTGRLGVLVFLGLSALVYSFLSPTFGFDTNSVALFLGLLVGLAFITAAFDLPLRIYHGRTSRAHDRGVLRALWWTLLVAVICVVVSRLANFQPGYLYGLVVSIVFVTEISRRDEGIGVWLASFWLIILSFAAWILLALVRQGSFDPWVSLFVQTMLVTFVVAGIETLVIGLLPMRFLPGHPLYQWKRGAWFILFALAVMGYLLILVDPANGYLSDDSRTPMLVGVIFLVTFGFVSVGTWAYFRYRPERARLESPPQAPST